MAEKQVVLSEEQFERLLAKIGESAPRAPDGVPGVEGTPDEQVQEVLRRLREGDVKREKHTVDEIAMVSAETGARFTAIVASSKSYPQGRVLTLQNYEFPAGIDAVKADGGLVPDGMSIKTPKGELTKQYKQWRWVEFYQADLRRYVGRDLEWLRRMAAVADAQTATGPR